MKLIEIKESGMSEFKLDVDELDLILDSLSVNMAEAYNGLPIDIYYDKLDDLWDKVNLRKSQLDNSNSRRS